MTPTTCGKPSPPRARLPSFPTSPRVHSNTNSTSISTPSAISSNVASASSNSSDASQPATKKPRETTPQSSLSRLSSYGSDKCPQNLAVQQLDRGFMHPRIARRDDAAAPLGGLAFPCGDDAAGPGDDRNKGCDVVGLQFGLDHE